MLLKFFERIGEKAIYFFSEAGKITHLFLQIIKWIPKKPFDFRGMVYQMQEIGVNSIVVVSLTSLATGMVLALQTASTLEYRIQGISNFMGGIVALSMTRELGPVLISLIVAGRVGSAIAAEIGTMKVTEQIDALHTLATNPVHYLAVPRFLACAIMLPVLTVYSDIIGILGGLIVNITYSQVSVNSYFEAVVFYLRMKDVLSGIFKAGFFGMLIALIGCYRGFITTGGAEGVGATTTKAVVLSSILILVFDYILTAILF